MSIFDPNSGLNAIPWLQEKVLVVLQVATKLIDLAKERDTTPWYRRNLKDVASQLVGRLAPVVALVYGAGDEAAKNEEWGPKEWGLILEERTPRGWPVVTSFAASTLRISTRQDGPAEQVLTGIRKYLEEPTHELREGASHHASHWGGRWIPWVPDSVRHDGATPSRRAKAHLI